MEKNGVFATLQIQYYTTSQGTRIVLFTSIYLSDSFSQLLVRLQVFISLLCSKKLYVSTFLNMSKTKELVIDFRKSNIIPSVSIIHGEDVQMVDSHKTMGTMFESKLKFDTNTEQIVKQGQQQIHLL